MPLKFPGAWRFKSPPNGQFCNQSIPDSMVEECIELIMRVATQGDRQKVLEHFKGYFCSASGESHFWSSSVSWAESDLRVCAQNAATSAPLFIEAFYNACEAFGGEDADIAIPFTEMINEILLKHEVGYIIRPPNLKLRENIAPAVPVATPPPTLNERAAEILSTSLNRSEQLLLQGRNREAVQEILWLLETVTTAFRGLETVTGTIEGKYFNQIVRELRSIDQSGTLRHALDSVERLHGYLSSPTGGGVRHGLDLNTGVPIGDNEARLFCNLIRSYLSFLLIEHQHLVQSR
jgi:hypothetical protein